MDKLQKCAKAFENLLEIQYRIIIGRKGKTAELVIGFSKLDFHHLMGLGKLKDLRIAKQNRGSVFDEIITGIMTLRRSVPFFVLYDSFSAMVRRKDSFRLHSRNPLFRCSPLPIPTPDGIDPNRISFPAVADTQKLAARQAHFAFHTAQFLASFIAAARSFPSCATTTPFS